MYYCPDIDEISDGNPMDDPIRVAVIGAGLAGQAHAAAYRSAATLYEHHSPAVQLVAIGDVNIPLARSVASRYGYDRAVDSWQAIAEASDIDAVSVVVHNSLHREIVEGLLSAGKHVLCEKPLAPSSEDAASMLAAATAADRIARVGFSYRRSPAISAIFEEIARGRLGRPLHFSGHYWGDYGADPEAPMGWRYRGSAGSGVLADLASHLVDIGEQLCGRTVAVSGAQLTTFVTRRPLPLEAGIGHDRGAVSGETEQVENEDYVGFSAEFDSGAVGSLTSSRLAIGHPNTLSFEVFGERGTASYDQRRPGEFQLIDGPPDEPNPGFRRVLVGPEHPYLERGLPMSFPGVGVGTNENFVFQARAFLEEIAGAPRLPTCATFADGRHNLETLEAVVESHAHGGRRVAIPIAGGSVS